MEVEDAIIKSNSVDHLWCNISALARGIYELAKSFLDEIRKLREGELEIESFNTSGKGSPGGILSLNATSSSSESVLRLCFHITQSFIWDSKEDDRNVPHNRTVYPIPDPRNVDHDATSLLAHAFTCFKRSGAFMKISDDGSLLLELRAHEPDEFWEVDKSWH